MSENRSSGGTGFVGLLTSVFIVLKLTGFITWTWWWVLSPIWVTVLLVLIIVIVAAVVTTIAEGGGGKR